jgi:hypothetical protein
MYPGHCNTDHFICSASSAPGARSAESYGVQILPAEGHPGEFAVLIRSGAAKWGNLAGRGNIKLK